MQIDHGAIDPDDRSRGGGPVWIICGTSECCALCCCRKDTVISIIVLPHKSGRLLCCIAGSWLQVAVLCRRRFEAQWDRGGREMRGFCAALCFGCSLLAATACQAATIQSIQGEVSVNQGQGFQLIAGAAELKAGDSVIVSPGGSASVIYADGCNVALQPGAVMVIAALSPCASGSYAQDYDHDHNPDFAGWAFGAVVAGTTGFVIYEIFQSNKNNFQQLPPPASN
jgi:hypothetical protein